MREVTYFKELKENGSEQKIWLRVGAVEEKIAKNGQQYIIATLFCPRDENGRCDSAGVKFFKQSKADFESKFPAGSVIEVAVKCTIYNSSHSYIAGDSFGLVNRDDYEIYDFIEGPVISFERIRNDIYEAVGKINQKKDTLKDIVDAFLKDYPQFWYWSGAKMNHHAYLGGLSYHTHHMVIMANKLPFINWKLDIAQYEKYFKQGESRFPGETKDADFLGNHIRANRKPEGLEQMRTGIMEILKENKFMKPFTNTLCLDGCDVERITRAFTLIQAVTSVYSILKRDLMEAALMVLLCSRPVSDAGYLSEAALLGRYSLFSGVDFSHLEEDERIAFKNLLWSVRIGETDPIKEPLMSEAFVLEQIWVMSRFTYIDKEFVTAACILHDMGKIREISTDDVGTAEYTVTGYADGHMIQGIEMLEELNKKHSFDPRWVLPLEHIIASHHGKAEWGTLAVPAFPEAVVVHCLDMIDSKMETYIREIHKVEAGEVTEKIWSLDNTRGYRRQND